MTVSITSVRTVQLVSMPNRLTDVFVEPVSEDNIVKQILTIVRAGLVYMVEIALI